MSAMVGMMRMMVGNKVFIVFPSRDDESDESLLTSWDRGRGLSWDVTWPGRPASTDLISIRDIYVMLWRYFNIFCWRTLHQQITFAAFQAFFKKKQLADLSFLFVTLITMMSFSKLPAVKKPPISVQLEFFLAFFIVWWLYYCRIYPN